MVKHEDSVLAASWPALSAPERFPMATGLTPLPLSRERPLFGLAPIYPFNQCNSPARRDTLACPCRSQTRRYRRTPTSVCNAASACVVISSRRRLPPT
jgi:hypothetical protein